MGVSIWGAVRLHSMDGWALSGADGVQIKTGKWKSYFRWIDKF